MTLSGTTTAELLESARWYDRSINWNARLTRELPVLRDVFGPPGVGGILDAGCGTGRQAVALAELGYGVTGFDASGPMLTVAREHAVAKGIDLQWVAGTYDELPRKVGGGFDGAYCLANSLAAAGTARAVQDAVRNFAAVLGEGGRLFIQILNFGPMREERPCLRGPRIVTHDGIEYVSTRLFHFGDDHVDVINVTHWNDGQWRQVGSTGRLFPVEVDALGRWCSEAGLAVEHTWGSYGRDAFDATTSVDLILVARKSG